MAYTIQTHDGPITIPSFNVNDFGWQSNPSMPQIGADNDPGPGFRDQWYPQQFGLNNWQPYGDYWSQLGMGGGSNNFSLLGDDLNPLSGGSGNPNSFNLRIKSGEKEGTIVPFQRQGEQYVPQGQSWNTQWDTNPGEQNRGLATVALAALGGGYLSGMEGAGAGIGADAGAGMLAPVEGYAGIGGAGYGGLAGGGAGLGGAAGGGGMTAAEAGELAGLSSAPAGYAGSGSVGAGAGASTGGMGGLLGNLGTSDWMRLGTGALGAFAGAQGAGPSSSTTTQNLPPELQGLLGDVTGRARQLGNMPFTPYTGDMVAPFNPYQYAGFDQIYGRASQPSDLLAQSEKAVADTASGKYLDSNPYLDDMIRQNQNDLQGRLGTTLLGSGSFGNANATQSGVRGMADAANRLRYQNYDVERGRQMQAAGMAPSTYQAGFMPGQALLGIGGTMQQQGQNYLNADRGEFDRQQQWPFQTYEAMMAPFRMNAGGSTTQTQPGGSRAAGALGGLLAAGQLYNTWFGGGR